MKANNMSVQKDRVVGITYTIMDINNQEIASNDGYEPLFYLHGRKKLSNFLEEKIEGMRQGDEVKTLVPIHLLSDLNPHDQEPSSLNIPETSSGNNESLQEKVQTTHELSQQFDQERQSSEELLTFIIKVVSIRDATVEEAAMGNVSQQPVNYCGGPGCC